MKIAITGSSGFVGKALSAFLLLRGDEIVHLGINECASIDILVNKINGTDAVINLAGAPIIKRWSSEYKQTLRESRVELTNRLTEAICQADIKPKFLFSTSAVGYYVSDTLCNEDGKNGNDFLAHLCLDWENAALKAQECGVRVCIGRFGIVLGQNGGALAQMLPIFKLGIGGVIASGKQPMSWIYLQDLVDAILFLMNNAHLCGAFNFASPNVVTNQEFTKTLGDVLHRPTFFPVPSIALKILYSEGAKVLTDGQIAYPKRLLENGFVFKKPLLKDALQASI